MTRSNSYSAASKLKRIAPLQVALLVIALICGPAFCAAACAGSLCESAMQTGAKGGSNVPPCHRGSQGKHKGNGVQLCKRQLPFGLATDPPVRPAAGGELRQ